jgi:hypothetical protein
MGLIADRPDVIAPIISLANHGRRIKVFGQTPFKRAVHGIARISFRKLHSQAHLNKVARQLNERPRETLQFETPAERFNACVASTG